MMRKKILIADDHVLVAEACRGLIDRDYEVVGIVNDGHELLQAVVQLQPDVVVLDISMPQLNGLDAGEIIRLKKPSPKLVYLTMNCDPEVAAEAFRRGASAYVLKQCSAEELVIALRRVLKGESYLSPLITKETVDYLLRTGTEYHAEKRLTLRQAEILQLLAEGKSMKEVAYILGINAGTVAFHKYRMMESLKIHSNAELMAYAVRRHMTA